MMTREFICSGVASRQALGDHVRRLGSAHRAADDWYVRRTARIRYAARAADSSSRELFEARTLAWENKVSSW